MMSLRYLGRRNQRERGQRQFPKFLRISHAVSGEFYKFVTQHHAEFGNPRLVIVSFVSAYHGPSEINARSMAGSTA